MPFKFRLKGLAETFVDDLTCPHCGNDGGKEGDEDFRTDLSRVTYDGIVVVLECQLCNFIFVPDAQRLGIINSKKLRQAVEKDCSQSGEPIYHSKNEVKLDVEKLNASRNGGIH